MAIFDIVNHATGGTAQTVVNEAGQNAQAKSNMQQLNTGYGTGAKQPNPAWDAWNQQKQTYESQLSAMRQQGTAQSTVDYLQQMLQQHLASEPPREIATALGTQIEGIQNAGAAATGQLQNDANQVRATGTAINDQQQQSASVFEDRAKAAVGRVAPQINVAGRGTAAQAGAVSAARDFVPNATGATGIRGTATTAAGAIQQAGAAATQSLGGYQASREGVNALQQFAKGPTGPSAAEAMLRLQAARDKATALSRARSARGGAGAVNEAMKVAQAEGSAQSADTRGQLSLVQAQEAAARRGESLQALTSAGSLIGQNDAQRLNALQAAGSLGVQSATAAGGLAVQGQTAATGAELQGSEQKLNAINSTIQGASTMRGQDIDIAKAQLGAELQQAGLNDQQTIAFSQLGEQARQAGAQAQLQAQQTGVSADQVAGAMALQYGQQAWQMLSQDQQTQIQLMGIERGIIQQNNANDAQRTQQGMQFLGTMLMAGATVASDRRAKHDIRRLRSMAAALRRTPGSYYRYKDPKDGDGDYTGPMAQDLESTREFRGAVVERGGKKTVDTGRLVMSHHAALSDLQRQIDRLEKLGRRKGAEA